MLKPLEGGEESLVISGVMGKWGYKFALVEEGIYFIAEPGSDDLHSIQFLDFATRETSVVAPLKHPGGDLSISPDGESILHTQQDPSGSDIMLIENFR